MSRGKMAFAIVAASAIITPFLTFGQAAAVGLVSKSRQHQQLVRKDPAQRLVQLNGLIGFATIRLPYATRSNFTGRKLYHKGNRTFLRLPVATALQEVAGDVAQLGYGLLIWDAYRPYSASKKMWALVPDERYVANPAKGSGHNRGIAVDLTLYNLSTGEELDMGTGFDHFSETAHHGFTGLNAQQQQNRMILKKAMEAHGFTALSTEWWHYSWQGKSFPLLDLSFRQLAKLAR